MVRQSRLRDANARLKHATEWLEDFTVHLSPEEIHSMVGDVEKTHVYTGSKSAAALCLTLAGSLGGLFGGLFVSSGVWQSPLAILTYVIAMPFVWLVMRRLTKSVFGEAIGWLALLAWFWAFLIAMGAVGGGQLSWRWLAYGVSAGFGLLVGLVHGGLEPPFIRSKELWMVMSLPLGGIASTMATYVHRHVFNGSGETAIAASMGTLAATLFTAPLMIALAALWSKPEGLRQAAIVYMHNPNFARKAIGYLDRAIADSPNDADLHNLRGIAWSMAGEPEKAEEEWRRVLELEPRSAEPHMNRGADFMAKGDFEKAIESFRIALQADPKHARVLSNLGIAFERQGQFDAAIEHYDRAIALVPDYANAFSNRAFAHFRAGRHDRAVEDCDRALALNPNMPMAYVNRGHAYAAINEHEAAIDDYRAAIELGASDDVLEEAEKGLKALGEV